MEGIIKSLAELVGAISSPIQVISVFIIVVAIVAVFIIKRGGFHAVLESSRRKWSRRTFLIVLVASIFFVLLLLIIVIVGLVQLDKIDLLKSIEKPGSDLLDIPETAVVLADEEYRQLVDRARRAFLSRGRGREDGRARQQERPPSVQTHHLRPVPHMHVDALSSDSRETPAGAAESSDSIFPTGGSDGK